MLVDSSMHKLASYTLPCVLVHLRFGFQHIEFETGKEIAQLAHATYVGEYR